MPVYVIVSKDKPTLGPNEIRAGDKIQVSDGDSFIVSSSANANISFQSGGGPAEFDLSFAGSNANGFDIKIEGGLKPSVTIPDNAKLSTLKMDAKSAKTVTFTAGNTVSFGKYEGSDKGADVISIGNGFRTTQEWKSGDSNDTITVGDDATFLKLETGDGNNSVAFGDRATIKEVVINKGNDIVRFGDDLRAGKIKTGAVELPADLGGLSPMSPP